MKPQLGLLNQYREMLQLILNQYIGTGENELCQKLHLNFFKIVRAVFDDPYTNKYFSYNKELKHRHITREDTLSYGSQSSESNYLFLTSAKKTIDKTLTC